MGRRSHHKITRCPMKERKIPFRFSMTGLVKMDYSDLIFSTCSWFLFFQVHPFSLKSNDDKWNLQDTGSNTVGALDMGGASTQITFYPGNRVVIPKDYSGDVVLYGMNYTVYTHSYLCYGINEIERKYKALLVKVKVTIPLSYFSELSIHRTSISEGYFIFFEMRSTMAKLVTEVEFSTKLENIQLLYFSLIGEKTFLSMNNVKILSLEEKH
jgi:hypothetical protein